MIVFIVTLDHKTSTKGKFFEIEIYTWNIDLYKLNK